MKVSQLSAGATIVLYEAGNVPARYTLVQLNYYSQNNDGVALLWRDNCLSTTVQWNSSAVVADSLMYQSSNLDNYLVNTWYPTLPASTQSLLTDVYYPMSYGNGPSSYGISVPRCVATVSNAEIGGSVTSGYFGTELESYRYDISASYWTREPSRGSTYIRCVWYDSSMGSMFASNTQTTSIGVRPTVGVKQNDIDATWNENLQAYTLSLPVNNVAPSTLYLSGTSGNHITDSQVFTSYQLTWPAATGNVTGYYVERSGSDGTTRIFGPYTTCEAYADAPNQGYMTYTYSLYTEFDGVANMVKTPVSCKVSSKNSKIWAYTPRYPGTGWSPNWYLATPKYYNGSSWQTCPEGVFCYTDSGKIRVYGSEISYDSWVEPVGTGFKENESGWWESQNKSHDSVSLCKIYIIGDGKTPVYIDYINSGENGYDYGLISALDTEFTGSETKTAATIYSGYDTTSSKAIRVLALGILPARTHYLYALYRKDGSVTDSTTNDSLQFRVRFG